MSAGQSSLFDAPVETVTGNAGGWLGGLLGGNLASALCVVAVAMLGIMMLSGRLPVRSGLKVVAGCFLLLSASLVAGSLQGAVARATGGGAAQVHSGPLIVEAEREEVLPPARSGYRGVSSR